MKTPCLERTVDQHGNGRCSVKVRLAVHHDDVNQLFQAVHNDILANGQSHATKHWWHGIGVKQGFDTLIKVDPSLLLKTLAKSPSNGRVERSPTAGAYPCHRCASTAGRGPGSCAQSPGQLWLKLNGRSQNWQWALKWVKARKMTSNFDFKTGIKLTHSFDSKRAFRANDKLDRHDIALAPGPNWSTAPSFEGMQKERPLGTWPPRRWPWPGHGIINNCVMTLTWQSQWLMPKPLYQSSQGAEPLLSGNLGLAAHEMITWAQESQTNQPNLKK